LTDNTAYLKNVLQALQPIAVRNVYQEEGVNCADITSTGEGGTGVVNSESTGCIMLGSEKGALIATPVQAHTVFSCLYSFGMFERQSAKVNIKTKLQVGGN
jgi:hypothetical protein